MWGFFYFLSLPFYQKFNPFNTIYFLKRIWFLYLLSGISWDVYKLAMECHAMWHPGLNNKRNVRKYRRVIKNGQSRETGNIGYTRHRTKAKQINKKRKKNQTKTQHNMCYAHINTNNYQEGGCVNPINRCNPAACLSLSQARTWNSNLLFVLLILAVLLTITV